MDESVNILVADDEREIADLLEICLRGEGYSVLKFYGGDGVLDALDSSDVSLVLLDVMMPGIGGVELCSKIREKYNTPIIFLTAKNRDEDKIQGLLSGADDYVTKPFNPAELIARVRAQLRRFINLNPQKDAGDIIDIAGMSIDKNEHMVTLYGEKIDLTPIEFDILRLLASDIGKVFSAEDIFSRVWKSKYMENSNNTVMVHIRHIREKLGDVGHNSRFIKTVWGVGYKIEK